MNPLRLAEIPVKNMLCQSGDMVLFYSQNIYRTHLAFRFTGFNFYVAYQERRPAGLHEMFIIDSNTTEEFWGVTVPQSKVWVRQDTGDDQIIKGREG